MTHDTFVEVLGSAAAPSARVPRDGAAKTRRPLASTAIHEVFGLLCPNDLLRAAGGPAADRRLPPVTLLKPS